MNTFWSQKSKFEHYFEKSEYSKGFFRRGWEFTLTFPQKSPSDW